MPLSDRRGLQSWVGNPRGGSTVRTPPPDAPSAVDNYLTEDNFNLLTEDGDVYLLESA